mgnify:CR=1 FL=1
MCMSMLSQSLKIEEVDYTEDYDWLIILDACRYDYFVKLWKIGKIEPRLSLGSCTLEVLSKISRIPHSVCLTGHPFVLSFREKFDKVIDAGFDYTLGTCPPWYMLTAFNLFYNKMKPYKRKILWFLQPHHPLLSNPTLLIKIFEDEEGKRMTPQEKVTKAYQEAYRKGILSKAYRSNLALVLDYVSEIIKKVDGIVVITSDHGEGLGEPLRPEDKPVFSHPCGREEWELRLIPWCVIDTSELWW